MISTSFADIFKQNSLKNSLLPIVVPPMSHAELFAMVERDPDAEVTVDLASQTLTCRTGARWSSPSTVLEALPAGRRGRTGLHPEAGSRHRGLRSTAGRFDQYVGVGMYCGIGWVRGFDKEHLPFS